MAQQREIFLAGDAPTTSTRCRGLDLRPDGEVRGYGFNKSHSAAYALVSYQTPG